MMDPWEDLPERLGVLAGGGTISGIFAPLFFQVEPIEGTAEKSLEAFFEYREEGQHDTRTV